MKNASIMYLGSANYQENYYRSHTISRHCLREMCRTAEAHGVEVVFFYLPYYRAPEGPEYDALYQECGSLLKPLRELLFDPELQSNVTHLNPVGAGHYTRRLAQGLLELGKSRGL